jgi:hypothetical protein
MKKLIFISLLFLLSSCYKQYSQPKTLSLSGEYIIDKVTYSVIENSTPDDKVFYPGNVFINPNESFPMDSIKIGFTRWHFDYAIASFNPQILPTGTVIWGNRYVYSVRNHYTNYDLGYIDINMDNGSRRIFKIIDDGVENLVLRTTNNWGGYGASGEAESVTLYLTRIGP